MVATGSVEKKNIWTVFVVEHWDCFKSLTWCEKFTRHLIAESAAARVDNEDILASDLASLAIQMQWNIICLGWVAAPAIDKAVHINYSRETRTK